MKATIIITLLALNFFGAAQTIKPCKEWTRGFAQVNPKVGNGQSLEKYITEKLGADPALLAGEKRCMVGFKMYVNCLGEFSYQVQDYRNDSTILKQRDQLQVRTENILKGIKSFIPATTGGQKQDFAFKLVVHVKRNGKPVAEVLY